MAIHALTHLGRRLLCDGAGPVYTPGHADVLAGALAMAGRRLDVEE